MNTFIGLGIPESAKQVLREALEVYKDIPLTAVPEEKWHITLVFLGNEHEQVSSDTTAALSQPLRCAYMPAITVLSLGSGLADGQLWARIHATPALLELRKIMIERLRACNIPIPQQEVSREFTPHITLAKEVVYDSPIGIPDTPAKITFAVRQATLFRSTVEGTSYDSLTTIPLIP